jgi:hypothetical protein
MFLEHAPLARVELTVKVVADELDDLCAGQHASS